MKYCECICVKKKERKRRKKIRSRNMFINMQQNTHTRFIVSRISKYQGASNFSKLLFKYTSS